MLIKLPFAERYLDFDYPGNKFDVIKIKEFPEFDAIKSLPEKLYNPIFISPINKFFDKNDKILIVLSDATRYTAADKIIPILIKELNNLGIKKENIEFIISTGLHRPPTEDEIKKITNSIIPSQFVFHIHNAYSHKSDFKNLGMTSRGTPILLNKIIFNFDKIIIVSSVGYHYFAGFSGGRKSLVPGLASIETIKENHKLVINKKGFLKNPFASIGRLKRNPVHLDLMECIEKITIPIFCIYALTMEKKLVDVICGDIKEAFRISCLKYASFSKIDIEEQRNLVIASCGGYPKDINLVQSHKTFENASYFCKKGGVIILIAGCIDGFGHKDFFQWLKYKDLKTFARNLRNNYQVNAQTAFSWKFKTFQYKVILISNLSKKYQKRLNVIMQDEINSAYNLSLKLLPANFKGFIIPYCSEIVPSIKLNLSDI